MSDRKTVEGSTKARKNKAELTRRFFFCEDRCESFN